MRFPTLAGLATLTACATISPPPTPDAAQIRLRVPGVTVERVAAAFAAERLQVGRADQLSLSTVPVEIAGNVWAIYHASVADGVVTLTGGIRNEQGAVAMAAITGMEKADPGEQSLHSAMTGVLGEAWARLERVAARLR